MLLASALALIRCEDGGSRRARALIDSSSKVNLATLELASNLKSVRRAITVRLAAVSGCIFETSRGSVTLQFLSCDSSNHAIQIEALLLYDLGVTTLRVPIIGPLWPHLRGIDLADPGYSRPGDFDLLVGAAAYSSIVRSGIRRGPSGTHTAQHTSLGWILFGATSMVIEPETQPSLLHGGYIVGLPLKFHPMPSIRGMLQAARRSLERVRAKNNSDPSYAKEYTAFIRRNTNTNTGIRSAWARETCARPRRISRI